MICGPVGAGKTTYALDLAARENAIVFSMDDWMHRLFGGDAPVTTGMKTVDFAWFAERVDRCEDQIWTVAEQLLASKTSVILDFGFIRQGRREKAVRHAERLGFPCRLHLVEADLETRRRRIDDRNLNRGQTYAFTTTPEMLAFAEHMYEAPSSQEMKDTIRIQT